MVPKLFKYISLRNNLRQPLGQLAQINLQRTIHINSSSDQNADKIVKIIHNSGQILHKDKPLFRDYWKSVSNNKNTANSILPRVPIESIAKFANSNRTNSSTVRGFYRRELIYNLDRDFQKVRELIDKLDFDKEWIETRHDILTFCINDSLKTKDVTIAVDLFILYHRLYDTEALRDDLCTQIISALALENPRQDHIQLLKFLALEQLYETRGTKMVLTRNQIIALCNKALALEHSPILTKNVLNKVMDIELTPIDGFRNEKIIAAYHLIEKDAAIENVAGVFLTWTNIKNYYTSIEKHDPRIIYKLINVFTHHKAYRKACNELIGNLSPYYYSNNVLVLPSLIDYATKTSNLSLSKELMNNVNKHLDKKNTQAVLFSKRCLSSLLRMHLKYRDSAGVDRVLQQIEQTYGTHSGENLSSIISHLLEVKSFDNLTKAIQLVDSLPTNKALLAYGSVINKIVEWQIASDDRFTPTSSPIIEKLLQKAHLQDPKHKSSVWDIMASLFIKKTTHYRNFRRRRETNGCHSKKQDTTGLDLAKLVYLRSQQIGQDYTRIDINPFIRSSPQKVLLKIRDSNRFVILRNIALNAIKGRREDIFLWSCSELYMHGMPVKELLLDWNMMLDYQMRRTNFYERKQIEEKLSVDKLPFINRNLR